MNHMTYDPYSDIYQKNKKPCFLKTCDHLQTDRRHNLQAHRLYCRFFNFLTATDGIVFEEAFIVDSDFSKQGPRSGLTVEVRHIADREEPGKY
jgi:hypothetical protein